MSSSTAPLKIKKVSNSNNTLRLAGILRSTNNKTPEKSSNTAANHKTSSSTPRILKNKNMERIKDEEYEYSRKKNSKAKSNSKVEHSTGFMVAVGIGIVLIWSITFAFMFKSWGGVEWFVCFCRVTKWHLE